MSSSNNTFPRPECPPYSWRDHSYHGTLIYVRDHCIANDELAYVPKGPLGFDLEWRPNFRKGENNQVAVIQLANRDTVWLIQVSAMSAFPSKLRDILDSNEWVKAGVNIMNDCLKLRDDFGVSTQNCVDLSLLARTVDNAYWKGRYTAPIGLSHLLETYENFSLPKGHAQLSNWEQFLEYDQQEYAANDAHAGYMLYIHLSTLARAMPKVPKVDYYSFSVINGGLLDISGRRRWQPENPFYDPGPPPSSNPNGSKKYIMPEAGDVTAAARTPNDMTSRGLYEVVSRTVYIRRIVSSAPINWW